MKHLLATTITAALALGAAAGFAQDADPTLVAQARQLATPRSEASFVRQ
jgi:hypothetical protein